MPDSSAVAVTCYFTLTPTLIEVNIEMDFADYRGGPFCGETDGNALSNRIEGRVVWLHHILISLSFRLRIF